jgi:hypothetical protein
VTAIPYMTREDFCKRRSCTIEKMSLLKCDLGTSVQDFRSGKLFELATCTPKTQPK